METEGTKRTFIGTATQCDGFLLQGYQALVKGRLCIAINSNSRALPC